MDCLFCDIVSNHKPSYIVKRTVDFTVILDLFPIDYGHCLVITNIHYKNYVTCPTILLNKANNLIKQIIRQQKENLGAKGFNITTNINKIGNQEIIHFHWHIIPHYKLPTHKKKHYQRLSLTNSDFVKLMNKLAF